MQIRTILLASTIALAAACGGDDTMGGLDAPVLDPVDSPTADNPLQLTGTGLAGAMVQVRGGSEPVVEAAIASDGAFSVDIPLNPDSENLLTVSQTDGTAESPSVNLTVVHDATPPDTPVLDPVATPTRRPQQNVRGSAEPDAMIVISGGAEDATGMADADGRFDVEVTLETAVADITQNDLEVVAIDAAGNESEPATTTIVHNPTLPLDPPLLDALPAATAEATVTLTGTADPSVALSVTGGDEPAMAMADAEGSFSVDVVLRPNVENVLSVFAVVPATGLSSPPASAVIVHDDIAPDPPNLDPQASPTGASMVRITGQSEPRASIAISGGASDTSGDADDDGAFAIDVMLTSDADNDLSVVASDRAGNESIASEVSITQDSSLPVPVNVDPLSSPTADNPITITGSTEASASIAITGGASDATGTSAADGSFSIDVTLNDNARNELHVTRAGSSVETVVVIVHDDSAPAAPELDTIASPTNRTMFDVSGTSEPGARVSVTGGTAPASGTADTTGRFAIPVTIPEDATTVLNAIATDRAGNSSSPSMVTVEHSSSVPDAPVVDDAAPPPTSDATYTVTGRITMPAMGVDILIRGGASDAMGPTDPSTGAFSVDVTLASNATNALSVVSVDGAIESPPTSVTVEHDDIAPGAPDGGAISLGSPTLATCLARAESINATGGTMSVEEFSRVRVLNVTEGSITSAATAGADGSFSTTIRACDGDLLRFTATDAAGNESMATELTVSM
jgi:hypothetical protein